MWDAREHSCCACWVVLENRKPFSSLWSCYKKCVREAKMVRVLGARVSTPPVCTKNMQQRPSVASKSTIFTLWPALCCNISPEEIAGQHAACHVPKVWEWGFLYLFALGFPLRMQTCQMCVNNTRFDSCRFPSGCLSSQVVDLLLTSFCQNLMAASTFAPPDR